MPAQTYNFEALKNTVFSDRSSWVVRFTRSPLIIILAVLGMTVPFAMQASSSVAVQKLGVVIAILLLLFLAVFLGKLILLVYDFRGSKRAKAIEQFAADNNLSTTMPDTIYEHQPDSIRGKNVVHEKIQNTLNIPIGDKLVTVYEYQVETSPPGSSQKYSVNYYIAAFNLKKSYPHLFLDGQNNVNNPRYNASQRIKLEGNFDDYFTLYAPDNSANHTGALAVISPDVMQTLIDTKGDFDIEIKDKYVYIISQDQIYTYSTLPKVLEAARLLIKEMEQLDTSWKPIVTPAGQSNQLEFIKSSGWLILLGILVLLAILNWRFISHLLQGIN